MLRFTHKLSHKKSLKKGFTLIELLIAVAIIGVLAVGLLAIINPPEQLARGRDGTRKSVIAQLGRAINSYYAINSAYPDQTTGWITVLQIASETKALPFNPTAEGYSTECYTGAAENGYCYKKSGTNTIVYARVESNADKQKAGCSVGQIAWIVWSSEGGKTGFTCTANATTDPAITGLTIN